MQSLEYGTTGTQTIAVWPEVTSSLAGQPTTTFSMTLSDDLGRQETDIILTLINTPTSILPRLVFQLQRSTLPQYTGNYTIQIFEAAATTAAIWGQINILWSAYDSKWSDRNIGTPGTGTLLDTDRAWLVGSDVPTNTQYTSPDETGAYTIYQG